MKTQTKIILGLVLLGSLMLLSCSKDKVMLAQTDRVASPTATILPVGIWKISSLQLNETDQGPIFDLYQFVFYRNGQIIASDGDMNVLGYWSLGENDVPNYFVLDFEAVASFAGLNGAWNIIAYDNLNVRAERLENGTRETLSFEKVERHQPVDNNTGN